MNYKKQPSQKDVNDLITFVDKNGDGKIGKTELFEIFKKLINS
jgi:Ca2+-binding EF-hand superfamily protein